MVHGKRKEIEDAIKEFKTLFPEVPEGGGKGARDTYSTYLHLIACYLELEAMTVIAGKPEATRILREWRHYTWIYDKVLNDPAVRKVNQKYGLHL